MDNKYFNTSANGTTTLKLTSGFLHSVTINNDGASGNKLRLLDHASPVGVENCFAEIDTVVSTGRMSLIYDVSFRNGLTIVMFAGTAADITVSYY